MPADLTRKVAIVTGGGQGIGASIVRMMAKAGAAVVIADVSAESERLAALLQQEGLSTCFEQTDVRIPADAQKMVKRAQTEYGGLDILVNCAGIYPIGSLLDTTPELWDRVLAVNLKGAFLCAQAAVPLLVQRGGGSIINIGSLHANVGSPDRVAYAVSKGGVVTLTKNLANALAGDQIRVNCVNPGWVATEGEIALRQSQGHSEAWLESAGKNLPMGRLQTGDDIAAMVLFFASDAANQVTGQVISVAGRP
ncbi:SDR family NAD(P)-dependent oxidoreductase [Alicyclobacillus fodiniaquatilis]|jgi:NAD(P)-dependent dehydrogenase (short-subunit alcohol dehydrogenase family)|uniref:SDR family NAD(P)-dependent oxidoreductase n=1 Tax=Alicyclobacillus fodiniaquatilis TaxID=1661150 RepID=A0ABW4JHT6_9BACL